MHLPDARDREEAGGVCMHTVIEQLHVAGLPHHLTDHVTVADSDPDKRRCASAGQRCSGP